MSDLRYTRNLLALIHCWFGSYTIDQKKNTERIACLILYLFHLFIKQNGPKSAYSSLSRMRICCFLSVPHHCKLNIFGIWSVGLTKEEKLKMSSIPRSSSSK